MNNSQLIDVSKLTPPDVIEQLDFEDIVNHFKAMLIKQNADLADTLSLESEPLTQLINVFAMHSVQLRSRINSASKSNMLATAKAHDLEHLGAKFGVSRLKDESDDRLRRRIQMAYHSLNTAGTKESYEYYVMSADSRISDVHVASPNPCEVVLTILSNENEKGLPSSDLIDVLKVIFGLEKGTQDKVTATLDEQKIRPIGDRVQIQPVDVQSFQLQAKVVLELGPGYEEVKKEVIAQVNALLSNQRKLGRSIKLSAIYSALHQAGVEEVQIISPRSNIELGPEQVSWCENGTSGIQFEVGL